MPASDRPLQQRLDALKYANEIRSKRANLKKDLKAGRVIIHDLLLDPPDYIDTMKVSALIRASPKYGQVKTNKVLNQCRISPSKTVGGMSQRQRTELVGMLRR